MFWERKAAIVQNLNAGTTATFAAIFLEEGINP